MRSLYIVFYKVHLKQQQPQWCEGRQLLAEDVQVGVVVEVGPHSPHRVCFVRDGARHCRRVELVVNVVVAWYEPIRPRSIKPLNLVGHYLALQNLIIYGSVQIGRPPAIIGWSHLILGAGRLI